MIELRKTLHSLLRQYHTRVYFQHAPETAAFPYIVWDLPNSFTDEDVEVFNVDVDVWDIATDTTALETLAGTLWKVLDNHRHIDNNLLITLYRENRLTLIDDDPKIKRRKLIFQLRYLERG